MAVKIGTGVAEFSALSLAVAAAGAAYLAAAPFWLIPLAALGTWSTMQVVLVRPSISGHPAAPKPVSPCDYDAAIDGVVRASRRIRALAQAAIDPAFRQQGADVATALDHVVAHLRQDPADLRSSQEFLSVYIERTEAIMARYLQFEKIMTPQAEQVRAKVRDELLPLLVTLCNSQLQRITYDDLRALDVDVDVLRKSITLEGL